MGEKEGKGDDGEKKKKAEGGQDGGGEGKKEDAGSGGGDGVITAVLKVDMHCEGCAKKVKRSVRGFEGVETVTVDGGNHKLTVVGKVDPWKLRERVEVKTHKKVVLVSPTDPPAKKEEKETEGDKKADEKPKAPVISTVMLKMRLHCEGCIQRIRRSIFKVKGVEEVTIDSLKDLVAVKGTMNVKTMVPFLSDKFKRTIEIIPAKKDDGGEKKEKEKEKGNEKEKEKDKEKEKSSDGNKEVAAEKEKDGGGGGGEKKKEDGGGGGGGEKKKEDGGGGGGEKKKEDGVGAAKVEVNKMGYYGGGVAPAGYAPYHPYYGYQYRTEMVHAPQYFSDENPNACSVM